LFADGEVIARKRKRGRPPKVAAVVPNEQTLHAVKGAQTIRRVEYPKTA
jgi:hypothetical protein